MRASTGTVTMLLVTAFAVTGWLWFGSTTGGDTSHPPSDRLDAGHIDGNDTAALRPDFTSRTPADWDAAVDDWRAIASTWLFESDGVSAGGKLQAGVAERRLSADAAARVLLDLLIADMAIPEPRLCRDAPIAAFLRLNPRPDADVIELALRYVGTRASQRWHRSMQRLLVGWPCFDDVSCHSALAAALTGLDDDAVWDLLRERLLREGAPALSAIVRAGLELTDADSPDIGRLALVMEALLSFADASDVDRHLSEGMRLLGQELLSADDTGQAAVADFGAWGPRMSAWGAALNSCLRGEPSRADALTVASRLRLLGAMFDGDWPDDPAESNAFHRLRLGLVDGLATARARDYLHRVATHTRLPGVRITALAKLGTLQSVEELERVFAAIVATDAATIWDPRLRVGFYAAVDNARVLDRNNRSAAVRVFRECLAEESPAAIEAQRFVLEALARNPLPELAWSVEQLAHRTGPLSDLAAQTLLVLSR